MSAVPYIGSKISLISKSEIRYEGILFSIDPKESTVALQNVRSFGTEGRRKEGEQIAPSNEVYDYIIFRGSDIKDLHVCEAPPPAPTSQVRTPNDPAIIAGSASQGPWGNSFSGQFPPPPHNMPYQSFPNAPFNPALAYGPYSNYYAFQQQQQQQAPHVQSSQSSVTTPSSNAPPSSSTASTSTTPARNVQQQPTSDKGTKVPSVYGVVPSSQPAIPSANATTPSPQSPTANTTPTGSIPVEEAIDGPIDMSSTTTAPTLDDTNNQINTNRQFNNRNQYNNNRRGGYNNNNQYQRNNNQQQQQQQQRYNNASNNASGGQRRGGPRYNSQGNRVADDFDFESANARFDKERILEEVKQEQGNKPSYDKHSSFFDNISCEATDRLQENKSRASLNEQRKLDAETFGGMSVNQRRNFSHNRGGGSNTGGGHQQQPRRQYNQNQQQQQQQYNNNQPQNNYRNNQYNQNQQQRVFRPVNNNNPRNNPKYNNNRNDRNAPISKEVDEL